MTRPLPTQTAQSEAARVPRVSDEWLESLLLHAAYSPGHIDLSAAAARLAFDLRDARQASRDKDAMIADLERRLAEAAERISDMIATGLRAQVEAHEATARADALQARLTEAEQRAATAERRGFEAGRDAAGNEADRWAAEIDPSVAKVAALSIAKAIRALAPAVPQEGETTP